jgi:hypothetical protein
MQVQSAAGDCQHGPWGLSWLYNRQQVCARVLAQRQLHWAVTPATTSSTDTSPPSHTRSPGGTRLPSGYPSGAGVSGSGCPSLDLPTGVLHRWASCASLSSQSRDRLWTSLHQTPQSGPAGVVSGAQFVADLVNSEVSEVVSGVVSTGVVAGISGVQIRCLGWTGGRQQISPDNLSLTLCQPTLNN